MRGTHSWSSRFALRPSFIAPPKNRLRKLAVVHLASRMTLSDRSAARKSKSHSTSSLLDSIRSELCRSFAEERITLRPLASSIDQSHPLSFPRFIGNAHRFDPRRNIIGRPHRGNDSHVPPLRQRLDALEVKTYFLTCSFPQT